MFEETICPDEVWRMIFALVGPEDTIWNCRSVCKKWNALCQNEQLAKSWVDQNPLWQLDWMQDNARINEKDPSLPLWNYCFNRVTVYKFFQKCVDSIKDLWKVEPPAPLEELCQKWKKYHKKNTDKKLPWEVFEFQRVKSNISLQSMSFVNPFAKRGIIDSDDVFDGTPFGGLTYKGPETLAWHMVGSEAEFDELFVLCDPKHGFGEICSITVNCSEGEPAAVSLVELLRGLYWQHKLMVKEYGIEKLKKYAPDCAGGSSANVMGDVWDYLRSVRGWTDKKGYGRKTLPDKRPKSPADSKWDDNEDEASAKEKEEEKQSEEKIQSKNKAKEQGGSTKKKRKIKQ